MQILCTKILLLSSFSFLLDVLSSACCPQDKYARPLWIRSHNGGIGMSIRSEIRWDENMVIFWAMADMWFVPRTSKAQRTSTFRKTRWAKTRNRVVFQTGRRVCADDPAVLPEREETLNHRRIAENSTSEEDWSCLSRTTLAMEPRNRSCHEYRTRCVLTTSSNGWTHFPRIMSTRLKQASPPQTRLKWPNGESSD